MKIRSNIYPYLSFLLCILQTSLYGMELHKPTVASVNMVHPKNLARLNLGANLESTYKENSEDGIPVEIASLLLSEDFSHVCPLSAGKSGFIFSLASIQRIQYFAFRNENAQGTVSVSLANTCWSFESLKWNQNQKAREFSGNGIVRVDLGASEAKYIRIVFNLTKSGRVAAFGMFGQVNQQDYKMKRRADAGLSAEAKAPKDYLNVDFLGSYSGADVAYVSSSSGDGDPSYITDDRLDTGFGFEPKDVTPTWIIDLREQRILNKVVMSIQAPPGTMKIYLLSKLPTEESKTVFSKTHPFFPVHLSGFIFAALGTQMNLSADKGELQIPDSFFENNLPTGTMQTDAGNQTFSIDFQSQSANYLMILFQPKDAGATASIVVNKISAFGSVELDKDQVVIVYEPEPQSQPPLVNSVDGPPANGEDQHNPEESHPRPPELEPLPVPPVISD